MNRDWHAANPMPKRPSLQERIEWHRAHQQNCACREVPKSLEAYFRKE